MNGFLAIFLKEVSHIRRERSTIIFAFVLPAILLTIFGYAIDVTIENIPTKVTSLTLSRVCALTRAAAGLLQVTA